MSRADRFLRACRHQPVDRTPVWIMRQAGRYLPEYRALRKRVDFFTLCKTPSLAAEATLLPVDLLDVDAAILFSDILVPVEAMGMQVVFTEDRGPVLPEPIRTAGDVERLVIPDPESQMGFVLEAIRLIRKELAGRVPLIGFSGAPFTLATYMIEGRTTRNFETIRRWVYERPDVLERLLDRLTETVIRYLTAQIQAGAQAVQIFDTWAGMLDPKTYTRFAGKWVKRVIQAIQGLQTGSERPPVILYVNGTHALLEEMAATGADVLSLDWRTPLQTARERLGTRVALQGNLDPCALFAPPDRLREMVRDILDAAGDGPGHIFNLGHGILPDTSPDQARLLVQFVHQESEADHGNP